MGRLCLACDKPLTSTNPRAKYCDSSCRGVGTTRRKQAIPELRTTVSDGSASKPAPKTKRSVHKSTLAELVNVDRVDTALGQAALALAARIDLAADTGSALASAVKTLTETLAAATKDARSTVSNVDELGEHRARRRA